MPILTDLLLVLTLLLCGGYAGMVLMVCIGVLPAMRALSPHAYADAWRAMDGPMGRRMPPYKGALLLLNVATVGVLWAQGRTPLAVAAGASLGFSLAGLVATVVGGLPLNARLAALGADAPEAELVEIRGRMERGMALRLALAGAAFGALCVGAVVTVS